MLEILIALTPILMLISYELGKINGQRSLKRSKDRYISFFNNRLIEVDK